jgi:hypothetical protein
VRGQGVEDLAALGEICLEREDAGGGIGEVDEVQVEDLTACELGLPGVDSNPEIDSPTL